MENCKLAILCLRYLTFECFDPALSEQKTSEFLIDGYYGFQDYAALHWVDHLVCYLESSCVGSNPTPGDLSEAIEEFFMVYGAGESKREDIDRELEEKCAALANIEFLESMLLMICQARNARKADEQISALGELGRTITKNRSLLETLSVSPKLEPEMRQKLELYYGTQWSKCPRHRCFYFHEGFLKATQRDKHIDRHERPFCCTESGCPRILIGFSSEKELRKHINIHHPDPSTYAWKFPKVQKESTKHRCSICEKEYTRANSLRIHLLTHNDERRFKCKTCGKAFVRKHDCERHERLLHSDEGR
jgi:hypothetical protein